MSKFTETVKQHKVATILLSLLGVAVLATGGVFGYIGIRESLRNSKGYVPNDEQLANAKKYKRVVIFGIDGAGRFIEEADTPNFDKIFGNGSINYRSYTQFQSDSGPNWGSMMHGVKYRKHKIHNGNSGKEKFTNDKYPSIFKIYNAYNPNCKHLSVHNWANINYGIIEDLDNVVKITHPNDDNVLESFVEQYTTVDPTIAFTVFDNVDAAGHSKGRTQEYFDAIHEADRKIGVIYDYLEAHNYVHETMFMCVADHGHKKKGGHGVELPDVYQTTIAVAGDLGNIIPGQMGKAVTHDVASIVLYGLGIKQPSNFDGKVPFNVFNTLK